MEFTVSLKRFKEAFSLVGRVVPTKSPRAVLQSVKVTAADDALSFEAAGEGVSIRHRLANAGGFQPVSVAASGVVLLPKATTDAILSVASAELATFRLIAGMVHVAAGSARWEIATEPPDAFPAVADFACPSHHTLAVADLKRLARRTIHAVDEDCTSYALGGMLAESEGPDLSLVGTDGHVFARQTAPAVLTGEVWDAKVQRTIPAPTINCLVAMLADGGSDVSIGFPAEGTFQARFGDTVFSGQLLNGRFPPWRKAASIADDAVHRVTVACEALRAATEQASALSSEDTRRVTYSFGDGACRLSATSADVGAGASEVPLEWEGSPLAMDLDPSYLVPMLKAIGDGTIECRLTPADHPNAAFVVATDDGFLGWVMAMSREAAR